VVHGRRVVEDLECHEVAGCAEPGGVKPVHSHFLGGGDRVGHRELLELRVQPGLGDQSGGRRGSDLLGALGEHTMLGGGEKALLDAQFA
jgi:hypothetical protein